MSVATIIRAGSTADDTYQYRKQRSEPQSSAVRRFDARHGVGGRRPVERPVGYEVAGDVAGTGRADVIDPDRQGEPAAVGGRERPASAALRRSATLPVNRSPSSTRWVGAPRATPSRSPTPRTQRLIEAET